MKVLVVGSGGREHALAWRLARERVEVLVAPGNGGIADSVSIQASDVDALADLARHERVGLTIVGPEAPLAAGLVDRFTEQGLPAFGPTQKAAKLEWSKAWTKEFLVRNDIPTGRADVVQSESKARLAVERWGLPVVLKADGLAGGKGVFVVRTQDELNEALDQLFGRQALGSAADQVLVEEFLDGPELSVLAFTDGEQLAVMPAARDYKRLLDGDRGPNTGGMGGYTEPEYATPTLLETVKRRILEPTLAGMQKEGHPYKGVLYAGLIVTNDGPTVLEFNCRFGDPEAQLILPRLSSSLLETCSAVVEDRIEPRDVHWTQGRTFGVVLASHGYPDGPVVGDQIDGLDELPEGVVAFHAGTRLADGHYMTAGGRVMTLVGQDRERVYRAAQAVRFEGKQYRTDIGVEALSTMGATQ
jgi:phosphoribosylamine--glycine ligase